MAEIPTWMQDTRSHPADKPKEEFKQKVVGKLGPNGNWEIKITSVQPANVPLTGRERMRFIRALVVAHKEQLREYRLTLRRAEASKNALTSAQQ